MTEPAAEPEASGAPPAKRGKGGKPGKGGKLGKGGKVRWRGGGEWIVVVCSCLQPSHGHPRPPQAVPRGNLKSRDAQLKNKLQKKKNVDHFQRKGGGFKKGRK